MLVPYAFQHALLLSNLVIVQGIRGGKQTYVRCETWCERKVRKNELCGGKECTWEIICGWSSGKCTACEQCNRSSQSSRMIITPSTRCETWCERKVRTRELCGDKECTWEIICGWSSGKCTACEQCNRSPQPIITPSTSPRPVENGRDIFGIKHLYTSSNLSSSDWTSNWGGRTRVITSAPRYDPADSHAFMKGSGKIELGSGKCIMRKSPRLYIQSAPSEIGWENIEFTAYGKYVVDGQLKSYSGLTLVARTNHGDFSKGCTAAGYYARIYRETGQAALQKEYYHDYDKTVYTRTKRVNIPEFQGGLPIGHWVGLKFVVLTIHDKVRLELYIDLTNNEAGGDWKLVNSFEDSQNAWNATKEIPQECANASPPLVDGDVVLGQRKYCFLRTDGNDDTEVHWASASIRHISAERISKGEAEAYNS